MAHRPHTLIIKKEIEDSGHNSQSQLSISPVTLSGHMPTTFFTLQAFSSEEEVVDREFQTQLKQITHEKEGICPIKNNSSTTATSNNTKLLFEQNHLPAASTNNHCGVSFSNALPQPSFVSADTLPSLQPNNNAGGPPSVQQQQVLQQRNPLLRGNNYSQQQPQQPLSVNIPLQAAPVAVQQQAPSSYSHSYGSAPTQNSSGLLSLTESVGAASTGAVTIGGGGGGGIAIIPLSSAAAHYQCTAAVAANGGSAGFVTNAAAGQYISIPTITQSGTVAAPTTLAVGASVLPSNNAPAAFFLASVDALNNNNNINSNVVRHEELRRGEMMGGRVLLFNAIGSPHSPANMVAGGGGGAAPTAPPPLPKPPMTPDNASTVSSQKRSRLQSSGNAGNNTKKSHTAAAATAAANRVLDDLQCMMDVKPSMDQLLLLTNDMQSHMGGGGGRGGGGGGARAPNTASSTTYVSSSEGSGMEKDSICLTNPERAEKLRRKRERNRDAARRCRDRKNQRLMELTAEVQEKQRTIDHFENIIKQVQTANENMRQALLHHKSNGCHIPLPPEVQNIVLANNNNKSEPLDEDEEDEDDEDDDDEDDDDGDRSHSQASRHHSHHSHHHHHQQQQAQHHSQSSRQVDVDNKELSMSAHLPTLLHSQQQQQQQSAQHRFTQSCVRESKEDPSSNSASTRDFPGCI